MHISPLHQNFGVEVHGVELRQATEIDLYPQIRELFEEHSLLLFRDQHLNDDEHLALSRLFGPIEDRSNIRMDGPEKVSAVTNVTGDGQVCSSDDTHLFHLKSNMLWHTDSTFLPVPALANVLQAQVVPSEGGATEFVSTRVGFRNFKLGKQEQLRNTFFHHRYSHSRARIDPELARRDMFTMWPDQAWRAAWTNPVNGEESVHIASHAFAVDGMNEANGTAFIDSLINEVTQPDTIYSHYWEPGDVLVWDERAMLHRGTPWPYDRPRTLVSTCVSARDIDGLASVWPN